MYRWNVNRHSSELNQAEYAAHGVLNAVTPVNYDDEDKLSVGVFSSDWPAWSIPFLHPRFIMRWIVVENIKLLPLVTKCFPSILVLSTKMLAETKLEPVDIIGYNGTTLDTSVPPTFGSICLFDWNVRIKNWKE